MKKRLISTLLFLSMLISLFALYSCGDDDKGGGTATKTNDQIFSDLKSGFENTASYTGAYTAVLTETETEEELDDYWREEETFKITVNPTEKILAIKETFSESDGDSGEYFSKLYKEGENYRYYEDGVTESAADDQYEKIISSYSGKETNPAYLGALLAVLKKVNSYAELAEMFKTVTQDSLDKETGGLEPGEKFAGGSNVEVKSKGDTSYLIISYNLDETYFSEYSNRYITAKETSVFTYAVKDGKLSGISMKYNYKDLDGVAGSYIYNMDLNYNFDSALFNSPTPAAPPEDDGSEDSYTRIFIDFVFSSNITASSEHIYDSISSLSASELFDKAESSALSSLCNYSYNFSYSDAVSYDGWYLDKACTVKFDPSSVSIEEFKKIKKLYAKDFYVKSGYNLLQLKDKYINQHSLPYQVVIALSEINSIESHMYVRYKVAKAGSVYGFFDADEIRVNGVTVNQSSFTVQYGTSYEIEYFYYYKDSEVSILGDIF